MTLNGHARRWRPLVVNELARSHSTLSPDLVLAVWWEESRGVAGAWNKKSGASGLGQVKQVALDFYNERHSTSIALADLRGTDSRSVELQARVSIWLLRWNETQVANWLPDAGAQDVYLFTLLSYHQGWGAVRRRLEQLQRKGYVLNWDTFKAHDDLTGWKEEAPGNIFEITEQRFAIFEKLLSGDGELPIHYDPSPPLPPPPDEEIPILVERLEWLLLAGALLTLGGLIIAGVAIWRTQ